MAVAVPEFWIQFEPLGGTNLLDALEGGYWSGLNVLHVLATLEPGAFEDPEEQVRAFAAVLKGAAVSDRALHPGGFATSTSSLSSVHMLLSQPADLNRSEQFLYKNITVGQQTVGKRLKAITR